MSMLANTSVRALMSMSGVSARSNWKLSGSMREEKSTEPSLRSNAPLRSRSSLPGSNWKALSSWSVSMEKREAMSMAAVCSAPKGSLFSTLVCGSASWSCTSLLWAAVSMTCRVREAG